MWEEELRSIKESQDFANERSIVSKWSRVKLGSVTAGLDLSNLHPTSLFLTCGPTQTLWAQLQSVLAWTITPSLAMARLLVPQIGKQLAAHAGLTPVAHLLSRVAGAALRGASHSTRSLYAVQAAILHRIVGIRDAS